MVVSHASRRWLFWCLAFLVSPAWAEAPAQPTVGAAIRDFLKLNAAQCPKTQLTPATHGSYQSMCVCMPARLRALQTELSPAALALPFSENDPNTPVRRALAACTAEQIRSQFGPECPQVYAHDMPNGAQYCRCMAANAARLSDAEALQLGLDSSDYAEGLAAAKKNGTPAPQPTPLLKRIIAQEQACKTP
jgi:hypothetical protein